MKRIFSIEIEKSDRSLYRSGRQYEVVASNAKVAIDKATKRFRKDTNWRGAVVVESLRHRGRII